jgi:hypothetical protein
VSPVIVTGFEALGRGHELNKLRAYFNDGIAIYGEQFMAEFNPAALADRLASYHNVDVSTLRKSPEQKQQEAAQQQQANAMDKAAGPVSGAVAKGMVDAASQ